MEEIIYLIQLFILLEAKWISSNPSSMADGRTCKADSRATPVVCFSTEHSLTTLRWNETLRDLTLAYFLKQTSQARHLFPQRHSQVDLIILHKHQVVFAFAFSIYSPRGVLSLCLQLMLEKICLGDISCEKVPWPPAWPVSTPRVLRRPVHISHHCVFRNTYTLSSRDHGLPQDTGVERISLCTPST